MSTYYPKLTQNLVQALRQAGFESIQDYFADIVKLKHALAKQEAREFIAASLTTRNSNLSNTHKVTETAEKNDAKNSYSTQEEWATLKQQIKPAYQVWYKTQRQQLNDKAWWKTLKEKTQDSVPLYINWEAQDKYKYYRSDSIVFIYHTVLPVFIQWLKFANAEFKLKKRKLAPQVAKDYQAFLSALKHFVDEHKKALRTSMLTRLVAAARQNDLRFDDVTVATLNELEAIGAIEKVDKPTILQRGMTPQAFYSFITILQQEGSWGEVHALKQLSYFKPSQAVTAKTFSVVSDNKRVTLQFLVPTVCADFMPKRAPLYLKLPHFLQNLFVGSKVRYEFFQDKTAQYLLASSAMLEQLIIPETITLRNLNQLPLLHDAHYFETLVFQEQQRIASVARSLAGVIYKKERDMLTRYHQHLKNVGASLLFKKVALLEAIIHQYETCENALTAQEKRSLRALITEINEDQQKWGVHYKFMQLETHCHMKFLLDEGSLGPMQNPTNQFQAQTALQNNYARTLYQTFETQIIKNPLLLSLEAIKQHCQALQTAFTCLMHTHKNIEETHAIHTQVYHYSYQFINALCELNSKASWLEKTKEIIEILALLKILSQINPALINVVTNLEKANDQMNHFDWEVIAQFKLLPEKDALGNFLKLRQSESFTPAQGMLHKAQIHGEASLQMSC